MDLTTEPLVITDGVILNAFGIWISSGEGHVVTSYALAPKSRPVTRVLGKVQNLPSTRGRSLESK